MGDFDNFVDTDGDAVQSKAFGKRLALYRVGAVVTCSRAPFDEDEYDFWRDRSDWPSEVTGSYQAITDLETNPDRPAMGTVLAYIDVVGDRFGGISLVRDPAVSLVDYYGRLVENSSVTSTPAGNA